MVVAMEKKSQSCDMQFSSTTEIAEYFTKRSIVTFPKEMKSVRLLKMKTCPLLLRVLNHQSILKTKYGNFFYLQFSISYPNCYAYIYLNISHGRLAAKMVADHLLLFFSRSILSIRFPYLIIDFEFNFFLFFEIFCSS